MKAETKYKELVKSKLQTSRVWQSKALLSLYKLQTTEEQNSQSTFEANRRGFSGLDGEILSSFAVQLQSKGTLSEKQFDLLSRKLPKYWKQIIRLSNPEKLENYATRTGSAAKAV